MLGEGAESGLFSANHFLSALEEIVGNFNGCLHNMATHIRIAGDPYQVVFPSRALIFSCTVPSILISGGQPRLWPSPGSLWVASIPILLPMEKSVVAWSRTSAGPLVKMASRCGSVLAQRRKRTSLVLWTFTSASTTTIYLVNIIWPMP